MNRYLAGFVVLLVAGVCCLALLGISQNDDTSVETEDAVHPAFTSSAPSRSVTVEEEQPEAEELVEPEVEALSNVDAKEVAAEPMIEAPMEIETEPEEMVSLDSFDRPYNHTVTEESFLKMSPEDQREVIDDVVADARELKMGVMGCYQETQELIKAGDYSAAEKKVSEILDASIAYDGGEGTLTLSRVIGLNSQNDLLGMMSQIYGAANRTHEKAEVDDRMQEIGESTKTLRERQDKSYSMYWSG